MPPIELRTILKESLTISLLLLGSYTIGAIMNTVSEVALLVRTGDFIHKGFVIAGTVVALLYVLVRTFELARSITEDKPYNSSNLEEFVQEGVILAIPVVFWFILAGLATALTPFDPLNAAVETLVPAFTRTAILTASLYLLARGLAFLLPFNRGGYRTITSDD